MSLRKILIADDEEITRKALTRYLSFYGEVHQASNAEQAIVLARENSYSLIITDNQMNDGHGDSGIYATRIIREFDTSTPIVIHTADLTDKIKEEGLKSGANEVLKKEISILRTAIDKYLNIQAQNITNSQSRDNQEETK